MAAGFNYVRTILSNDEAINLALETLRVMENIFEMAQEYNNYVQVKAAIYCLADNYALYKSGVISGVPLVFAVYDDDVDVSTEALDGVIYHFNCNSIDVHTYSDQNGDFGFIKGFAKRINRRIQLQYNTPDLFYGLLSQLNYYDLYQYEICNNLVDVVLEQTYENKNIELPEHICIWLYNTIAVLRG